MDYTGIVSFPFLEANARRFVPFPAGFLLLEKYLFSVIINGRKQRSRGMLIAHSYDKKTGKWNGAQKCESESDLPPFHTFFEPLPDKKDYDVVFDGEKWRYKEKNDGNKI